MWVYPDTQVHPHRITPHHSGAFTTTVGHIALNQTTWFSRNMVSLERPSLSGLLWEAKRDPNTFRPLLPPIVT